MRYEISEDVNHGCCYAYSVVDTDDVRLYDNKPNMVCEVGTLEEAAMIADALNLSDEMKKREAIAQKLKL